MATLNVILHGLFSVHQRANDLVIYLPRVDGVHVYRAGDWLAETELHRGGIYWLRGVTEGKDKLKLEENVGVPGGPAPEIDQSLVHATLLMPRPKKAHSLRPVAVDRRKDFSGDDAGRVRTTVFPTVHVLQYDVPDMAMVRLEGHSWDPAAEPESNNLHVLSEEEVVNTGHARDAFGISARLLNIDLRLEVEKLVPPFAEANLDLPAGVIVEELEDLVLRMDRVREMGQAIQGGALKDADHGQALLHLREPWDMSDAAGTKIGSCALMLLDT